MLTYLSGAPIEINPGVMAQPIINMDSFIGRKIKTNEDFMITIHIEPGKKYEYKGSGNDEDRFKDLLKFVQENKPVVKTKTINLKGQEIRIDDVIRTCGLYLYCSTMDNQYFAIDPKDLEKFKEIN